MVRFLQIVASVVAEGHWRIGQSSPRDRTLDTTPGQDNLTHAALETEGHGVKDPGAGTLTKGGS
ncbi:hypothetical protein SARC_01263 [Sphaeroforma arctica JP610]|uniref:Uncharacterized protein n=1 Tax=Sphaeroforma arctica JP610 TaxID=667725 RepID=A0A0L0GC68_9EUKA|nr:hypothetical protein SARC_01263 [Sphaeroforma arctica JP610]KNC86582.1 hypothetical protein SARC_01263 [Sphaeroforma arctica JP610]|eukprot:XP_014160484.1 hypothetical protein SARC_01263 [Sphaeroforma arctica JP610]